MTRYELTKSIRSYLEDEVNLNLFEEMCTIINETDDECIGFSFGTKDRFTHDIMKKVETGLRCKFFDMEPRSDMMWFTFILKAPIYLESE